MSDPEGGRRPRWWRRLPRRLDRLGSGLGHQLRARLAHGAVDAATLEEIFELLVASDCGAPMAEELVQGLRERAERERLREPAELLAGLRSEMESKLVGRNRELRLGGAPGVWLVAGVNGSGKTTTVAKLAARIKAQGLTPLVAAGDTFRAAAQDQLRRLVEPLGVDVVGHRPGADPAAVVYDAMEAARARRRDLVLVDTAGRLHTKDNLMQELAKVRRVIAASIPDQPEESLLVLDAYVGANALAQARAFSEVIGATGVVLTKLDGSARGGYVFQVERELDLPVKLVGTGEGADDLDDFDPAAYVSALLADEAV